MAPVPRNTIEHFTHPQHRLILEVEDDQVEYLCDGCKTVGRGTRYRCNEGCSFDLHEYCATCPKSLSSSMHPQHPITLVIRKPQATRHLNRVCDMCRDPVEGLFYRCKGCEFDVHPLCTKFPEKLRHALDTRHHLKLRTSSSGSCAVCGGGCTSWRYGCVTCCLDIHIHCVLAPMAPTGAHSSVPPPAASSSTDRGIPGFDGSRSPWPPQYYPPPPPPHYPPPPQQYPPYYPPPPSPHYPPPPQHYPPPPSPHYPPPQQYPHYHGYGYGVGIPNHFPIPNYNMYNPTNHVQGGVHGANGGLGNKMFGILGQLTLGVLSNIIFGAIGVDASSLF